MKDKPFQALSVGVAFTTLVGAVASLGTEAVHKDASEGMRNSFLLDDDTMSISLIIGSLITLLHGAYLYQKSGASEKQDGRVQIASMGKAIGVMCLCASACFALAIGFGPANSIRPDYESPSGAVGKTLFGFMYGGLALLSAISLAPEIKKSLSPS